MKPQHYAGMGIGLYTDSRRSVDYTGDLFTQITRCMIGDVYLIKYNDDWNSALIFTRPVNRAKPTVCHRAVPTMQRRRRLHQR
jgi:hypothetical protein